MNFIKVYLFCCLLAAVFVLGLFLSANHYEREIKNRTEYIPAKHMIVYDSDGDVYYECDGDIKISGDDIIVNLPWRD